MAAGHELSLFGSRYVSGPFRTIRTRWPSPAWRASFGGRAGFFAQCIRQGASESQKCCIAAIPGRNATPDRYGHDLLAVAFDEFLAQTSEMSAVANGVDLNIIRQASRSCKNGSVHDAIDSSFWGQAGIPRKSRGERSVPACHLHGNILGKVGLQTLEGPMLQFRRLHQQRQDWSGLPGSVTSP